MKIDITALLLGKLTALPPPSAHQHASFALALDKQRITFEQEATLDMAEPLIAVDMPPTIITPLPDRLDPASVAEEGRGEETLMPPPTAFVAESQWQLQQWVNRRAQRGDASPVQSTAVWAAGRITVGAAAMTDTLPVAMPTNPKTAIGEGETNAANSGALFPVKETLMTSTTSTASMSSETTATMPGGPVVVSTPLRTVTGPVAVPTPPPTISYPPETPEWKQEVSQHIAMLSRNGVHNAEIRLHPDSLGSLHISLRMQNEQAQVHITSEHALVRQAMEQALPQLRVAMAESGVQLSQASVSGDNPQAGAGDRRGTPPQPQPTQENNEANAADAELLQEGVTLAAEHRYGINTFA